MRGPRSADEALWAAAMTGGMRWGGVFWVEWSSRVFGNYRMGISRASRPSSHPQGLDVLALRVHSTLLHRLRRRYFIPLNILPTSDVIATSIDLEAALVLGANPLFRGERWHVWKCHGRGDVPDGENATEDEHGVRSHVPALGTLCPEDHSFSMRCELCGTAQWRVIMKKQSSVHDVAVTWRDSSSRVEGWARCSGGIPKAETRAESGAYFMYTTRRAGSGLELPVAR